MSAATPEERLLNFILDTSPPDEPYHDKDCPACDVASEVVGTLGAYWDVDDDWFTAPAVTRPGLTRAQEAEKIVAHVMHRRLGGGVG